MTHTITLTESDVKILLAALKMVTGNEPRFLTNHVYNEIVKQTNLKEYDHWVSRCLTNVKYSYNL